MPMTVVRGDTVSKAWHEAVQVVRCLPGHRIFHSVVNIADPLAEHAGVRNEVDALLARLDLQPVETVANTIMPLRLANRFGNHAELVLHYRQSYDRILEFPGNNWGTYFGRLVAYPIGSDRRPAPVDQLVRVINDLSSSRAVAAQYDLSSAKLVRTAGVR